MTTSSMTIHRPKNEAEWHSIRSQHITGSDAPVVAGVGYEDLYTRWARKTGTITDLGDKLRFRVGHALEPLIHKELEERRGLYLYDPGDLAVAVARRWCATRLGNSTWICCCLMIRRVMSPILFCRTHVR